MIRFISPGTALLHIQKDGKIASCLFRNAFSEAMHSDLKQSNKQQQKTDENEI